MMRMGRLRKTYAAAQMSIGVRCLVVAQPTRLQSPSAAMRRSVLRDGHYSIIPFPDFPTQMHEMAWMFYSQMAQPR